MAFTKGAWPATRRPGEVEFVEAIPKNPSGKILRRVLKEQELARG